MQTARLWRTQSVPKTKGPWAVTFQAMPTAWSMHQSSANLKRPRCELVLIITERFAEVDVPISHADGHLAVKPMTTMILRIVTTNAAVVGLPHEDVLHIAHERRLVRSVIEVSVLHNFSSDFGCRLRRLVRAQSPTRGRAGDACRNQPLPVNLNAN